MSRPLPLTDFRARRRVLTPNDFALPGRARRPSDRVDKKTWRHILSLPDDVSVRTSNHHGSELAMLYELESEWIGAVGEDQDTLYGLMLDASDDFQAAQFNALCGYYRLSFSALRSALELLSIGSYAQASGSTGLIEGWRAGTERAGFGKACDGLLGLTKPREVAESLFSQRTATSKGGMARQLFEALSHFSHSRPGYTDADLRNSNGPIYVRGAFQHCVKLHAETLALAFIFVKIARPAFVQPSAAEDLLLRAKNRLVTTPTRRAWQWLFTPQP